MFVLINFNFTIQQGWFNLKAWKLHPPGGHGKRRRWRFCCPSVFLRQLPRHDLLSRRHNASCRKPEALTDTVARVTDRKRRQSVYHLSTTKYGRSELRGVDDHSLSYCTGAVADRSLLFWTTRLIIPYGEDDEPRGPRGRATDRWRCHLSSTTTTESRRRRR